MLGGIILQIQFVQASVEGKINITEKSLWASFLATAVKSATIARAWQASWKTYPFLVCGFGC